MLGPLVRAQIARRYRHPGRDHPFLGGVLQAHRADAVGVRSDPDQAGVDHRLREVGVFAEEAVAGMDRLRAGFFRGGDDLLTNQIALARRRRPDMHRFVRLTHVQRIGVGIRIDRNRADTHFARGADDPAGDLAPVGDEERLDHPKLRKFTTFAPAPCVRARAPARARGSAMIIALRVCRTAQITSGTPRTAALPESAR